ncbi:type III PLP-dependent enzyme [Halobacillus litoralis]|uniref:type III PLP-dependent enzyme n=1 Tax=Halobacillus litoralis TaxID=45668 RepID=UPI00136D4D92|nr:type III PLP-dependent enzyme [Halobacillus litoralis]MYL38781.1 siderophore biosynthesis PLP-dependent protein [Halobacillus litoralis]
MDIEKIINEKHRETEPVCAYVYDLQQLKTHAASLKAGLPDFCELYYAVKANPDPNILEALAPIIDGFDTASEGEMEKAEGERPLLFGAPAKKDREIASAVEKGIRYINVESLHDLYRINEAAGNAGKVMPVLLRVNLRKDVPESHHMMSGTATQFGIDEYQIPDCLNTADRLDHVDVKGFHFHAMSNNLDARKHVAFTELCIQKAKDWAGTFQLDLETVDVGGGIGVNYWDPDDPFDWPIFAAGLHQLEEEAGDLTVILELGRYMTAECGSYVTEVLDVKENHDKAFALVRGGSHHLRLPAAWKMSHPFRIIPVEKWEKPWPRPHVAGRDVTITGELCTPNDVLVRAEKVDTLRAGDLVVFEYAGAYAWTISHHEFLSHPEPQMIYVDE